MMRTPGPPFLSIVRFDDCVCAETRGPGKAGWKMKRTLLAVLLVALTSSVFVAKTELAPSGDAGSGELR